MDLDTIVQAATKSTLGAVIVGLMYGVSLVIKEWRGGSASEKEQASLNKRMTDMEGQLQDALDRIAQLERDKAAEVQARHRMQRERDQARTYAEFLELKYGHDPVKVWPADPEE